MIHIDDLLDKVLAISIGALDYEIYQALQKVERDDHKEEIDAKAVEQWLDNIVDTNE